MTAAAIVLLCPVASAAQSQTTIEGRVGKLEGEMRAVQRKVFPGGAAAQPVEPQFTDSQQPAPAPGVPSSTPITDLTARVSALESQMSTMTGQIERLQFDLRQERDANAAYRRSTDARLKALEEANMPTAGSETTLAPPATAPLHPAPATVTPLAVKPAAAPPTPSVAATKPPVTTPAATKPAAVGTTVPAKTDPARAALLGSIERPSSDDPAEDGYTYGFRLWQAKLYPEAIAALKDVTAKYPKHRRWSYAQNLLGRSYLDAGAPATAATVFAENYEKQPNGARAPDSLYYLAQALTMLKKSSADICRVYAEINEVYGDKVSPEIKSGVAEGRAAQKCP
jgi:TolA-binding protein